MAIAVSAGRSKPERRVMRYEDRLASWFETGVSLRLMALAHIGGFTERLPGWLATAKQESPASQQTNQRIFDALQTGDVATIETAMRELDLRNVDVSLPIDLEKLSPSDPVWVDRALLDVIDPLILLGRADLVATLHANSVQRLGADATSELTVPAAQALAEAGEWDHCLDVIKRAPQTWPVIDHYLAYERQIWKHAYLHGRVDSVMPILAEVPFSRPMSREAEARPWRLKAYQIRAGASVTIPVIEGEQPFGYTEAAAMQIAALAHDPASAELVQNLQRVLRPKIGQIIDVDRGIAFSHSDLPDDFSTAEAQIAARRKDYAKAAALARTVSPNVLTDPPMVVINAFLEEGDWRAAAEIAKAHDPRKKKLIPGFDDTRSHEYLELYIHLAIAAARAGDDDPAAAFLATSKTVDRTEVRDGDDADDALTDARFFRIETLFAGAAEGRLPRKYLDLLIPTIPLVY
jgi:hypothetical protein